MGPVRRSLEEWRGQIDGHRSGGWGKHQGSQEEFGEDGVAMGPVKQTADQVSRDQDWRELDRQEWIANLLLVCGKEECLLLILSWILEFV